MLTKFFDEFFYLKRLIPYLFCMILKHVLIVIGYFLHSAQRVSNKSHTRSLFSKKKLHQIAIQAVETKY